MRHARADYQRRIQDSEDIIPEEEPVFLLRGQDPASPATLESYADLAEATGASEAVVQATRVHAESMRQWQKDHPESVHAADMPTD